PSPGRGHGRPPARWGAMDRSPSTHLAPRAAPRAVLAATAIARLRPPPVPARPAHGPAPRPRRFTRTPLTPPSRTDQNRTPATGGRPRTTPLTLPARARRIRCRAFVCFRHVAVSIAEDEPKSRDGYHGYPGADRSTRIRAHGGAPLPDEAQPLAAPPDQQAD